MNPTNDPKLKSFIEVSEDSHFSIQNLPFGAFRRKEGEPPRIGVRIGDFVLDVRAMAEEGLWEGHILMKREVTCAESLNPFLSLGRAAWMDARLHISRLLRADEGALRDNAALRDKVLLPVEQVKMELPVRIGDYTDFYSSKEHATNVGVMFRGKENALMPNWVHLPVAYHGRSSSVVPSGTNIHRPCGQVRPKDDAPPLFAPSRLLDFELEMGFFTGPRTALGQRISVDKASEHIFGMVLVNDWSARDIQKWEYQPLGPFNAKNFATSISPWVVTLEALEPFRCAGPEQDPEPLPYLESKEDGAFDIRLEVYLESEKMEKRERICQSNFKHMYWNIRQQLAHHTVTGCNIRPGDLMASGTISAPKENGYGSLLELTWRGEKPIRFSNGEERKFIQDHDIITMSGWCQGDGYRVGFGEVTGKILPSLD